MQQIIINQSADECRLAVLTDGVVSRLSVEHACQRSLVDDIYLGTVVRVLPAMQAAFVDIGREKMGFLHADDLPVSTKTLSQLNGVPVANSPLIEHRLRQGEQVLVQVVRDELGEKGVRLTANLAISTHLLVYRPDDVCQVKVSHKIRDKHRRQHLQASLRDWLAQEQMQGGLMVRTLADDASDDDLQGHLGYLGQCQQQLAANLTAAKLAHQKTALLYQKPLSVRIIAEFVGTKTQTIIVDDGQLYHHLLEACQYLAPDLSHSIVHHTDDVPVFIAHQVEQAIQIALSRQVPLKSGGYLVIEETEAMVSIDVNTGSFVGHSSPSQLIYQTNLEAADVIASQLILRNLGGIIVIDFIDMKDQEHRTKLYQRLQQALSSDSAKTQITQVKRPDLVVLTRERSTKSLLKQLYQPCKACQGVGWQKSPHTLGFEIMREILRLHRHHPKASGFVVMVHESVLPWLSSDLKMVFDDLKNSINKQIEFRKNNQYRLDQFAVQPS
ncbi:Rne/Rng family ribonuclease [Moraxella sp.]|uniref:Rne/Rng family ribonuclease n=1 Tax=Moraxella sp. TaxID=479 RepID=UPI0026DCFC28|nr:Rne/Rng family ribonuclease [Moraxella sp.]MDO4893924.1 Rne/Rng family ribonuclease [Moraxella sp.]